MFGIASAPGLSYLHAYRADPCHHACGFHGKAERVQYDGSLVSFFQLSEAFSRNLPGVPSAGTENPKKRFTAHVRFLRVDMYPEGLKPAHESVRRSGKHLLPVLSKVITAIVVPTTS
jgi:hypothetical protein